MTTKETSMITTSKNPADFKALIAWGKQMGSQNYYTEAVIERAIKQEAPVDAIYERNGVWTTVRHLALDHPFRGWYEKNVPSLSNLEACRDSLKGREVAPTGALAALDLLARRHSSFKRFEDLCTAGIYHAYTPTVRCRVTKRANIGEFVNAGERVVLADAFDAAMEAANIQTRANRVDI